MYAIYNGNKILKVDGSFLSIEEAMKSAIDSVEDIDAEKATEIDK